MTEQAAVPATVPVDLATARTAFGRGASAWAHADHQVAPTWWLALSGAAGTDYNHALLHGDDAAEVLPGVLERIGAVAKPALVLLAGAGLSSAQQLADAGWVCVGALPLMHREATAGVADDRVRSLAATDLADARRLLTATFGVAPDSAEALLRPALLERPEARTWGLFDPDLVSCAVTVETGGGLYVGWALATAPGSQHRRCGSSLLGYIDEWYRTHGALASLHLGTPAGARLYAARGHRTLEHWQLWSRPRWLLGRS